AAAPGQDREGDARPQRGCRPAAGALLRHLPRALDAPPGPVGTGRGPGPRRPRDPEARQALQGRLIARTRRRRPAGPAEPSTLTGIPMTEAKRMLDLAARLALRGAGDVEPNPLVGAVLVRDGQVVGLGHHRRFG